MMASARLAYARRLSIAVLLGLVMACFAISSRVLAQGAEAQTVEAAKTVLEEVEAAVGREDVSSDVLASLRQSLNAAMDTVRGKIDELEPKARDVEERLKQLGPAPAKDAPPETPGTAAEREQLAADFAELDGAHGAGLPPAETGDGRNGNPGKVGDLPQRLDHPFESIAPDDRLDFVHHNSTSPDSRAKIR